LQFANQSGVVDFSIGYINEQICGYEMRDANKTASGRLVCAWGRVSVRL